MSSLQFLNHAGVLLETSDHLLLIDPWLEGTAFNNGWALIDRSTSNQELIDYLQRNGKPVTVWYTHEHPDHFSISFFKALQKVELPDVQIIYQDTMDHRVADHLRRGGCRVIEAAPRVVHALGREMSLAVWPFLDSSDSYGLVRVGEVSILNMNDCLLDTSRSCVHVSKQIRGLVDKVDFLLTQFGYAEWIGNEDQLELRQAAAMDQLQSVALQIKHFDPGRVIPFASFSYFCHEENFYLNDAQTRPENLLSNPFLARYADRLLLLKPRDRVELVVRPSILDEQKMSHEALSHWARLEASGAKEILTRARPVPQQDLGPAADEFRFAISRNLLWFNWVLEAAGVLRPIEVYLTDSNRRLSLSYIHGLQQSRATVAHLICTSEILVFILKNDFGFNTTLANGRFRTGSEEAYRRVWRFFILQNLKKMGFGISTPLTTLALVARNLPKFFRRRAY